MKLKTIMLFSLSLASLNAFSWVGSPGVTVENVKRHCSRPGNCEFVSHDDEAKEMMLKKNLPTSEIINTLSNDEVDVSASTSNKTAHVNETVRLPSHHTLFIHNETDSEQRFVSRYEISSGDDDVFQEQNINLCPHCYYSDKMDIYVDVIRGPVGYYQTMAMTGLQGDIIDMDMCAGTLTIIK